MLNAKGKYSPENCNTCLHQQINLGCLIKTYDVSEMLSVSGCKAAEWFTFELNYCSYKIYKKVKRSFVHI